MKNSIIPTEYDFEGIGIHEALIMQARINERIEIMKEEEKQTSPVQAVTGELELLSLAIDHHITQDIKRQETDKTRARIKEAADRAHSKEINDRMGASNDEIPPDAGIQQDSIR